MPYKVLQGFNSDHCSAKSWESTIVFAKGLWFKSAAVGSNLNQIHHRMNGLENYYFSLTEEYLFVFLFLFDLSLFYFTFMVLLLFCFVLFSLFLFYSICFIFILFVLFYLFNLFFFASSFSVY